MENFGKIEKREHTDPELLEAEAELEEGKDEKIKKIVKETLEKDPIFDELSEEEKEEAIERDVDYLKDINKRGF